MVPRSELAPANFPLRAEGGEDIVLRIDVVRPPDLRIPRASHLPELGPIFDVPELLPVPEGVEMPDPSEPPGFMPVFDFPELPLAPEELDRRIDYYTSDTVVPPRTPNEWFS